MRWPRVTLPIAGGCFGIAIADGRIAALEPAQGAPQWLLLPAFANMHCHAERSYALAGPPRSLADALRLAEDVRARSSVSEFQQRAATLFGRALDHGTLRLRTHTDVDDLVDERALRGVMAAREQFAGRLDVEIVAFANARVDVASAHGRRRLERALDAGADLIGAVPALAPDPARALDAVLDLGAATGAAIDLHLDEHGEAKRALIAPLIARVQARRLEGRVTVSHACALAVLPQGDAQRLPAEIAAAGIDVVALPGTNLYHQDRAGATPRRRGITLVRELLAAGVAVRFGSDNVRDSFYPYGDADPLEDGFLASIAAHIDDPAALVAGLCGGRGDPAVGDVANLVLVRAGSLRDALARRPRQRIVLREGRVVAGALMDGG